MNYEKLQEINLEFYLLNQKVSDQFELKQFSDKINNQDDIETILCNKIDEWINEVEIGRKNKIYNDLLPIIRLKIEYIGILWIELFNY